MKIIRPYAITDATLSSCNVLENDYPAYNPATTYAQDAMVMVVGANVHKIYQSLQGGNKGQDPASSPAYWLDRGANNRWAMFDTLVNSQTVQTGDLQFTLAISGRVNALALLNVYGASVRVVATDTVDGVVYDRTIDMRSNLGIIDWWGWFFEPPEWDVDAIFTDLPMYSNMSIAVTVANIGGTAKLGMCVAGLTKDLGDTQYGAAVGIQDYSVKTFDTWGNATLQERAYSKHSNLTVFVDNNTIDRLQNVLAGYRAIPILYIGVDEYGCTAVFGFYKDFSITISYVEYSVCSIEIEGLI